MKRRETPTSSQADVAIEENYQEGYTDFVFDANGIDVWVVLGEFIYKIDQEELNKMGQ